MNLSMPTSGSCLDMIKELDKADENDINLQFGHPYAADFLRAFNNYRYTTQDGNQVYGTGKCLIPPAQKGTFKLNATCSGTNDKGDNIQLKLVPKTCQKMSYSSSELADSYDGCIVERTDMPRFFNYIQGLLQFQKDEVVSDEVQENVQRYQVNQQLLRDIDTTIGQRLDFTRRANEASQNADNAISGRIASEQLEQYYITQARDHRAHIQPHIDDERQLKQDYDYLYNTSRMDASVAVSPIPGNAQLVNVLGDVNMNPWQGWFRIGTNFPDKQAQFIHPLRGANLGAPYNVGRPWRIYGQYVHNGPSVPVKVQFFADYYCAFYFNDALKGSNLVYAGPSGRYHEYVVSLQNGRNVFRFDLVNVGGPSGLLISVLSPNNDVILRSNGNWAWVQ